MIFKKSITYISIMGTLLYFLSSRSTEIGLCDQLDYSCRGFFSSFEIPLTIFLITLLILASLSFLKESIYYVWWNFAKFAIPVIFILMLLISFEVHHSQHGQWQDMFDDFFIYSLLFVFFVGSLIQIIRGYLR